MSIKMSKEWIENLIALKQLKFERAMEKFDIEQANIACAQKKFYERELKRISDPQTTKTT